MRTALAEPRRCGVLGAPGG